MVEFKSKVLKNLYLFFFLCSMINFKSLACHRLKAGKRLHFMFFCVALRHYANIVVVLVAKSCQTLCDPMDCSLPGSPVCGISQVRILEWVAISFPGDLPDPGIKLVSPAWQVDSLPMGKPIYWNTLRVKIPTFLTDYNVCVWERGWGYIHT